MNHQSPNSFQSNGPTGRTQDRYADKTKVGRTWACIRYDVSCDVGSVPWTSILEISQAPLVPKAHLFEIEPAPPVSTILPSLSWKCCTSCMIRWNDWWIDWWIDWYWLDVPMCTQIPRWCAYRPLKQHSADKIHISSGVFLTIWMG